MAVVEGEAVMSGVELLLVGVAVVATFVAVTWIQAWFDDEGE